MAMRISTSRFRALERIDEKSIWEGIDENGELFEFNAGSKTYYDDRYFVCHEDISRSKLKNKIKGKKVKNDEIRDFMVR